VLELLVEGVTSNRDLAERLFVSENTIKYHLRNILQKLHLQNRAQVIAYAVRHGLVEPS
jgi:DNA-binding NarL/FixJ family response regulator